MWIHSLSHLDTLFFFLQFIIPCFESVRVLNTLAPARSPVYIIMAGFKRNSAAAKTFEETLLRNNGTVSVPTVPMWQISDFKQVEKIMNENPSLKKDLQAIWNQKKECLRETRLFAEKKFQDDKSVPLVQTDETGERKTAAVCGVSNKESVEPRGSLLTIPKSFGPPPRKN